MHIFRQYDIRGIAEKELTSPIVWALGRALADKLKEVGDSSVYVGQDVRESSPRLVSALHAGLVAGGMKVCVLSPGPTPFLYFMAAHNHPSCKSKSGVMITGSHNPPEYNGFKMVLAGKTIHGEEIQVDIKHRTEKYLAQAPASIQTSFDMLEAEDMYVNFVFENIRPLKNKIKVVVDAGNGAAGQLALATYKKLGCDVVPLYCEFDSRFPNHHPDPTIPENLADLVAKVRETGAHAGIAYDGDGDRIGAVSPGGKILFGDQLILYFAREILKEVSGPTVISEVKSSQVMYDQLAKMGAKPIVWKTGHSLIKAKLKETGAALAGEMSGHMFFSHRYFGFDDAIYSGARLIEGLDANMPESLDQFLATLPAVINTPELRLDCPDDKKFAVVDTFIRESKTLFLDKVLDIDGARIALPGGWGLLRASNTQPVLVMRFEADTVENLRKIRNTFADILAKIDSSIVVPNV
jgi:phosphomannomutase/phosphoglucomutase